MANWKAGTSSDAVGASGCEYDVFLNFRGQDTRHNFTDFLYDRLVDAGVHTFRDEEKLPDGDVISDRLEHAINNSKLYVSVFSWNYASSKWCLRELKLIMDNVSNSRGQKSIIPIFFLVEPDDLKLKTRRDRDKDAPYKAAFEGYEREFSNEAQAWKTALGKVDECKGRVVKEDTSQAMIVKLVVKEVLEKLKIKQKSVTKHLVGLDNRIKELTELLDVNHNDVRLVGIYGMGGIGKTTIATVVFNQLCSCFGKCCSFLEGIRERLTKDGIVSLQKQLLSDIGGSEIVTNIYDSGKGMSMIRSTLNNKKVLVVLDDVDKQELIKNLLGNSKLYQGSRIIITTRDMSVLEIEGFEGKTQRYDMLKMDASHALQLFGQCAFSGDFPLDDYCQLSSDIVSCLGGLPLAIEVIGSLLNGKGKEFWGEKLKKLRIVSETKILETLRISYDDLEKNHKQIFLDIACFFFNEEKTDAIYMWNDCQFYPLEGIEILTNRCLIRILDDKFWMHDQLIALGRQIVYEASQDDPENQSRLWIAEEALQIIGTKKMKDKVQALVISRADPPIEITNENFENLPNLRFLNLNCGTYVGDFAKCHSKLRWFSWKGNLDWQFRADNLYLDKLVVCKLSFIGFKDESKAWDLIKRAHKLKVLSIEFCNGITTILDISRCSALERLTLRNCSNLEGIKSFIGDLKSLIDLKILSCDNFTNLPEKVGELVKLKRLSLMYCRKLRELPSSLGKLTSLMELDLSETIIRKLPDSIGQLKSLRILRFTLWSRDWWIYSGIDASVNLEELDTLVNLEELDLSRNILRGEIPIEIGEWSSLRILNLEATDICRIPKTINKLHHLQTLNLANCHKIEELPELPTSLTYLLLRSKSLLLVPNLSKLTNLVQLLLSDCSDDGESKLKPGCNLSWIGNLSKLEDLDLNLQNVPAPLELASLSHLKCLVLNNLDLKPLVQLPSSDWNFRSLSTLRIVCVEGYIPLQGFSQLDTLNVASVRLQRLSIPPELKKLRVVDVYACRKLVEIQILGLSKSLENMRISLCKSLTRISGLSYLKNLSELSIEGCDVLTNVEGLNELESLKFLLVCSCKSLTRLIDASCTKIPDDCTLKISFCGYPVKDAKRGMHVKHYKEEILLNGLNKTQDEAEFDISGSDEVPDASVGESENDGNSSIVDFRSEPSNTECFEATGNRRQMRDGRIGRYDSVEGGKMASIKNRKKDKDVKRDKNVETDRVPTKTGRGSGTGCASNPGRDPTERGRQRGRTSRNGEGLSSGRDPASTLGRYKASNLGREMASISQSSTTSSSRRDGGSTSGRNTTLTLGRGMTLSSGTSRGSSSRTDKTKIGIASSPKKGITSSLRNSASLSIGRGRGSTLGEGASVSSGRGMTLSLGTGRNSSSGTDTTKIGTASSPGRGITSSSQSRTPMSTGRGITSSSQSRTPMSTGRGRGSTSGKDTMASSVRGKL